MNSHEFFLWLKGYLEALESEEIEVCKIERILLKMNDVRARSTQERVVFGPNIKQQGYAQQQQTPPTNKGL